jgi:hypothetical protein
MMNGRAPILLSFALIVAGCASTNPVAPDQLPDWLTSLIRQVEGQPVASPPVFIAQYEYRGETVYYVPARCCDVWSTVYRASGAIVCHPDGGLTGSGDGRCPSFPAERTNERIIWRDPRGTT